MWLPYLPSSRKSFKRRTGHLMMYTRKNKRIEYLISKIYDHWLQKHTFSEKFFLFHARDYIVEVHRSEPSFFKVSKDLVHCDRNSRLVDLGAVEG